MRHVTTLIFKLNNAKFQQIMAIKHLQPSHGTIYDNVYLSQISTLLI